MSNHSVSILEKHNNQGRFMSALSMIQGKRVEYKELIGQTTL